MATLILTAVGTAIGGPIGGLIGTLVGSQVDRLLLGGPRATGPRLKDLSVQLASYGEPVPLVYGRARIAGTLIWSSGLVEQKSRQKVGGKGGRSVTTYTYSVSLAVGLSGRPITDVGRIWADGKLIRSGTDQPLTAGGDLRIFTGSEGQLPDPLIEAAVGVTAAPAHRGLAYVVIEDLPLADFANHIPNLTFEVIADSDALTPVARIATDIIQRSGSISSAANAATSALRGYAFARPQSGRSALEALGIAAPFQSLEGDDGLAVADFPASAALTLPAHWLGSRADGAQPEPSKTSVRADSAETAADLTLLFWDEARDYQTNVQRAQGGVRSGPAVLIEAPAVMTPDSARKVAEQALDRQAAQRDRRTLRLPPAALALAPGDAVLVADDPGRLWLVEELALTQGVIEIEASALPQTLPALPAAPLSPIAQLTAPAGATTLVLADLPMLPGQTDAPRLIAAGAGSAAGWRRASLYLSRDGGASYTGVADLGAPATIGTVAGVLGAAATGLRDDRNSLTVTLLRADLALESRSDDAVLAGANLALVGGEIIQFGSAQLQPDGRYRLSRLLRGRFGTEAAIGTHAAGETFLALDAADLAGIDLLTSDVGATLLIKALTPAQSLGDVAATAITYQAVAAKPLAPVHVSGARAANGDWTFNWVRRSRTGYAWTDSTDAPLGEATLAFDVDILSGSTVLRTLRVTAASCAYPAADQLADFGVLQTALTVEIAQISDVAGRGLPTRITLTS